MKVAVITPYYQEDLSILMHCHESVRAQTYPCVHVMVADGYPQAGIGEWQTEHITLPRPHHDIGSTPRLIGCIHAIGLGYDAVAFLDADNWYAPKHIDTLVSLFERTGAGFLSSGRLLHRFDGSFMVDCPYTDPDRFIDTNCMMVTRGGFPVLMQWVLMPDYAHLIGDRAMLHYFKAAGVSRAHSPMATVHYRCGKSGIYSSRCEPIPAGVVPAPNFRVSFDRWVEDGNPSLE